MDIGAVLKFLLLCGVALAAARTDFTIESHMANKRNIQIYSEYEKVFNETAIPIQKLLKSYSTHAQATHYKYLKKFKVTKFLETFLTKYPQVNEEDIKLIDWLGDCCEEQGLPIVNFFANAIKCYKKVDVEPLQKYLTQVQNDHYNALLELRTIPYDKFTHCLETVINENSKKEYECLDTYTKTITKLSEEVAPRWKSVMNAHKQRYGEFQANQIRQLNEMDTCVASFNYNGTLNPNRNLVGCFINKLQEKAQDPDNFGNMDVETFFSN